MCPFCLAGVGLLVAKATSAGGLTALAVKLSRRKNKGNESTLNSKERSNSNARISQEVSQNIR